MRKKKKGKYFFCTVGEDWKGVLSRIQTIAILSRDFVLALSGASWLNPRMLIPSSQGHAEDMVQRHRYCYYVLGASLVSDAVYDALERAVKAAWPVSVVDEVGSSRAEDYPSYIREGRRPLLVERMRRDQLIEERWMKAL